MDQYLNRFLERLSKKWNGSLVKVSSVSQGNAKEYMNRLANEGQIEKVTWGWYYIPDETENAMYFLRKDRNFKILVAQTAASFWNGDFIHRNVYLMVVEDRSYKKALEAFARKKGWNFRVEINENARKDIKFVRKNGLNIEKPAESATECLQRWAFTDAFSIILTNKNAKSRMKDFYWKRVSGTNVRIGQVMGYAMNPNETAKIPETMKEDIDESVEKVMEFA